MSCMSRTLKLEGLTQVASRTSETPSCTARPQQSSGNRSYQLSTSARPSWRNAPARPWSLSTRYTSGIRCASASFAGPPNPEDAPSSSNRDDVPWDADLFFGNVSRRTGRQYEKKETANPNKALKINIDLWNYKARRSRMEAYKNTAGQNRNKLLRQAEKLYRQCLAADPVDGRAYVGLGKILTQTRRIEEARQLYEDGSNACGGENAFIWQAWAVLEEKQGNVSKARNLFDAGTVADKAHAASWHGWGMLEQRQGDYEVAKDLFYKGIVNADKDSPNVAYLYQSLGVLYHQMRQYEMARQYFLEGAGVIERLGRMCSALYQAWALMEAEAENYDEAEKLFKRALEDNPRCRYTWLAWAMMEAQTGSFANAEKLVRRGIEMNPRGNDCGLLQALGILEARNGRYPAARAAWKQALKNDPAHQPVWQAWGLMEWKLGNVEEARDKFQRGVWADSTNPNAATCFQAWGMMEHEGANIALARQLYQCAVKADPNSTHSWGVWARLEEEEGNLGKMQELREMRLQSQERLTPLEAVKLPGRDRIPDSSISSTLQWTASLVAKWFSSYDELTAPSEAQTSAIPVSSSDRRGRRASSSDGTESRDE